MIHDRWVVGIDRSEWPIDFPTVGGGRAGQRSFRDQEMARPVQG